ncbi:MAG: hypothetical protein AVDCRST_MAG56-3086 [uncultured Cytophagales bacterium]|uniref:Carrier domain-containing protein n=1 Tax=uncultured Cytophagales bacterium TaxID=158755 RepID=A0A6J4J8T4_9SPHI|nr:MAG: hypothetical protein AVDCRST_MAG56-3086 [uncultured Cytophagales bacterium]
MMKEKIARILSAVLEKPVAADQLHDNADLIREFGFNSLDMIQFILQAEEEFDIVIEIEDFDIKYFNNLAQLMEFFERCPLKK